MLRIFRSVLCSIFGLAVSAAVVAQPAQKIIVQLKKPLTAAEQRFLHTALSSQLSSFNAVGVEKKHVLEKLEQSTELRWILKIQPAIDEEELKGLIEKIEKIDPVQFVEQDRLLKPTKM